MKYNFSQLKELANTNSQEFNINSSDDAYLFCEKLAKSHYENFPVGTFLIPKSIRKHFYSIYAFARLADDIADENLSVAKELRHSLLSQLEHNLDVNINTFNSPILKAVIETTNNSKVKKQDLIRLLIAFKMDINFKQPKTFEELYNYCHYSANPIGEMLLKLFEEDSEEKINLSNKICTGLQLVNFWQDISVDKLKNRCYIPINNLRSLGVYEKELDANPLRLQVCLDRLYQETENLFDEGKRLVYLVKNKRLKLELRLIISSGIRILEKCKDLKTEIIYKRPSLGKMDAFKILYKVIKL